MLIEHLNPIAFTIGPLRFIGMEYLWLFHF